MKLDSDNLAEIVVGARGWLHPSWEMQFYPDDLPTDWKLGYYANEYRCVLVPAEQWIEVDDELLEQWADDASEDFSLFFELPETLQPLPESIEVLGDVLAGFVASTQAEQVWRPALADWPIWVPLGDCHTVMNCYARHGQNHPSLVVIDTGEVGTDLADLRAYIESVLVDTPKSEKIHFIIGGEAPSLETMQNVTIIAELIGA